MTQEKKAWLEKMANIIDQLQTEFHYTNASVDASPGDVFFDDACRYVDLVFELDQLARCMRNMVKYSEMGEHKPEKK